ncbi:hypothetical protein AbraCBS73388_004306 [Aspergillus brasiliensis]|uniref:HNH nuclease domain-containing protein n=1 Tax=Aspergillus brasiliensis TaxID=319629 RepID=A0A9W5YL80_9EURO|nr:hypothetical protein AbraCBS73388_004306 [Aspergillus brasiliensis]
MSTSTPTKQAESSTLAPANNSKLPVGQANAASGAVARSNNDEDEDDAENTSDDEDSATEEEPPTKKRRVTSSPEQSPSASEKEATSLANKLCTERDNASCVITGCRDPVESAHIFPKSMGKMDTQDSILSWYSLQYFWSKEKVNAWREQVNGPNRTEVCSNLLCMTNLAQKLWKKARFALKPLCLSEDRKSLQVQFYWLPVYQYRARVSATEIPSRFPKHLSGTAVHGQETVLFSIATDRKVCSGDILTFTTNDPDGHPLPSMELLDLQWVLNRVLALSGATYATDKELYTDDWSYELDFDWASEEDM